MQKIFSKKFWIFLSSFFLFSTLQAQRTSFGYHVKKYGKMPTVALGLSTGTKGFVGADVTVSLGEQVSIKTAYHYFQFGKVEALNVSGFLAETTLKEVYFSGEFNRSNAEIMLEFGFFEWKKFRFDVCAAYFFEAAMEGDFEVVVENSAGIQRQSFKGFWTLNSIAPYAGIGFGRSIPIYRIGLNFDLGVWYLGKGKTEILNPDTSGDFDAALETIETNLQKIKWYPTATVALNFRLGGK